MANRQRPNTSTTLFTSFYGVKRLVSPISDHELKDAGFEPAVLPDYYVQDMTPQNPFQIATIAQKVTHLVLQGEAGTGKDEYANACAAVLRRPIESFSFLDGGDPTSWIWGTDLDEKNGATVTKRVKGSLLRACQGVTIKRDMSALSQEARSEIVKVMSKEFKVEDNAGILSITIPSIILISDYDRAKPEHLEILRQALELNKERLAHPITGALFPILKGTRFIFTGNSGVDGDGGRGMLFTEKDGSLISRLGGICVPPPTPKFERSVLAKLFPQLTTEQVKLVVDCSRACRKLSKEMGWGLPITLRQSRIWTSMALEVMEDMGITDWKEALKWGFMLIKGHLSDETNIKEMEGAVTAYLDADGVLESATSSESICPIDLP